jgi:hypothetical protein
MFIADKATRAQLRAQLRERREARKADGGSAAIVARRMEANRAKVETPEQQAQAAAREAEKAARVREHAQAWAVREDQREVRRATANPRSAADVALAAKAAGLSVADYSAAQTLLQAREQATNVPREQRWRTVKSGGVNHSKHAMITACTLGLWAPVWALIWATSGKKIKTAVPR